MTKELEDVLRVEQDALLKGDFQTLEALVPRKEALTNWLATNKPDLPEHTYQSLKDRAARNEALLTSARRGLQAALVQVRQAQAGMEQTTYSSSGERRPLSKSPSSVTQKV